MATYLVSAITMPIFGLFGDNCGHRVELMILGGLFNTGGHLVALFAPKGVDNQIWARVPYWMYGFGYSIYITIVYSSLPIIAAPDVLGTAYGILISFNNTGMTILPLAMGSLVTHFIDPETEEGNYVPIHWAFIGVTSVALALKIGIYIWDKAARGGVMVYKDANTKFAEYLDNKYKK